MRVERVTAADVDAVAALERAAFRPSSTLEEVRARLRDDLLGPLARAWVARAERDVVVGYASALHAADELHVLNVATDPLWRRRGVGRALVDAMLTYAAAAHVRVIVLEVRRSNAGAIQLYRRAGFAAVNVRRRYYGDDEDAIEMLAELDASGAVIARPDEVKLAP